MSHILILYGTVDGQTGRIAERIARVLRHRGHEVTVRNVAAPNGTENLDRFDGVIVGGGIRFGRHPKRLVAAVRERVARLATPTAFYSVCLSAGGPGARPEAAKRYVATFLRKTGWRPSQVESFGGALLYRRYSFAIRTIIRFIMLITKGERDTSRDYEYTDWQAVDRFALDFGEAVGTATPALRAIA
jgi:menaquinone-dependent protoporphyrinogen oxidase